MKEMHRMTHMGIEPYRTRYSLTLDKVFRYILKLLFKANINQSQKLLQRLHASN